MRGMPKYTESVEPEVTAGSVPKVPVDDSSAQLYGKLSQTAFGLAQKSADERATQTGAQDASKTSIDQGIFWQPESNFTEAGRAYNASAEQVSAVMTSNQMQQHIQNLYLAQNAQPYSVDSIHGTIPTFNTSSKAYLDGVLKNSDPTLHPMLLKQYAGIQSSYSRKLANNVADWNLKQSAATNLSNLQESSNTIQSAINSLSFKFTPAMIKNISDLSRNHSSALSALVNNHSITPVQQLAAVDSFKNETAKNFAINRMSGLINIYNSPTLAPDQKNNVLSVIKDMTAHPYKDPMVITGLNAAKIDNNKDISFATQLSTQAQMGTMYNHLMKSVKASSHVNTLANLNIMANAQKGKSSNNTAGFSDKQQAQYQGSLLGAHLAQNAIMAGVSAKDIQGEINTNPVLANIPAYERSIAIKNAGTQFKSLTQQIQQTPAQFAQNQQIPYIQEQANAAGNEKNIVTEGVSDPRTLMTQTFSPTVKKSVMNVMQHSLALQQSLHVPPAKQGVYPESQLIPMVQTLNGMTPAQGSELLSASRANLTDPNTGATVYPSLQNQLINSANAPLAAILYNQFDDPKNPAKQAVVGALQNYENYQQTNEKGLDWVDHKKLASNIKLQMANLQNTYYNSPYNNGQGSIFNTEMQKIIMQVSENTLSQDSKGSNPDYSDVAAKAYTKVVEALYYHINNSDSYRIPRSVPSSNGDIPIDNNAVNYAVSQFNLDNNVDYQKSVTSPNQKFASKFSMITQQYKSNVANGRWVNDNTGYGLVRIDSNNRIVKDKNGKPLTILFSQATKDFPHWYDRW